MAEAAVEENPSIVNKFFCHKCRVEIPRVLDDYTCPTCLGGFIEELEDSTSTGDDGADSVDFDFDMAEYSDVDGPPSLDLLNQVNELLFGLGVERYERDRGQRGNQQLRALSGAQFENQGGQERSRGGRGRGRRLSSRARDSMEPIEHVIQDFIVNLTGVGWGPMGPGGRGNGPVRFFLGNPGDYAWGREGLDAIVTQLLNQMDATGPPPLEKDKIDEIPVTVITQEQAEAKLQCSVCWEDYEVGECVRKLECEHYYHEKCIVTWLELHGTCPICRKSLSNQPEERAAPTSMHDFSSILRGVRWGSGTPSSTASLNTPSSTTSTSTSTSTSSSNSSSSRRAQPPSDDDMDLEYG